MFKMVLVVTLASAWVLASENSAGAAKAFNPDISANFLGLYKYYSGVAPDDGASLQEVETQFTADVDPYLRAVALFSISRPPGKEFGIDPEEVFAESLSIPNVTLKVGKFKAAFGKHNPLHTHGFPFIDAPLANQVIFGDEGLNEVGVSAAVLTPLPWYSEVTVQALTGENDRLFNSGDRRAVVPLVRLKNLWDLSDSATAEVGLSGATGRNGLGDRTNVFGADLTYKWRPVQGGKYRAFIWTTEYLARDKKTPGTTATTLGGVSSWVQYQFAERWWAQARGEYLGLPVSSEQLKEKKMSLLLGFFPSEFSGFRVQYDLVDDGTTTLKHGFEFQINVSIGAHPAHAY